MLSHVASFGVVVAAVGSLRLLPLWSFAVEVGYVAPFGVVVAGGGRLWI